LRIEEEQMHGASASQSSIPDPLSPIHYSPSSRPSGLRPPTSGLKTALFVGRIYPVKGLPMLVEAWAQVRPVGWKMRIVGPDEAGHRAEVEALVCKAGLEEVFEFTGALDGEALHQAYAAADLFMLPSHTENFGMVVGEALAHGLPVIATQGSPWNGLLDHACGWWTGISSDGIASALQAATALDPTELRTMGARGRQWMKTDFSWDQCAGRMAELYRSIA
jgi:glycosyltransferase involved in cell wall biosynthesis